MTSDHDSTRCTVMTALAALWLGATTTANAQGGEVQRLGSRTLVACSSPSGNARVVAGMRGLRARLSFAEDKAGSSK